ncbi:MAG: hypothetical protein HND53_07455 [Proteobacteria bacterium]|nr:hypothetical protein [Pseudomonadota bacterium]NOG60318.1 hypothetical protein [Pseudomonadota bacterium]
MSIKCKKCTSLEIHNKKRSLCKKCYFSWYNKTQRNKEDERIRLAEYKKNYPEKVMLANFRTSAKKQGISINLTSEWIKEKLDKGVCEASGLPIVKKPYLKGDRGRRTFYAASLDRIDNSLGYTQENCRIVCWGYNLIKNNYTDRDVNAFVISMMLQFIHKDTRLDLLNMLPEYCLEFLPTQSKHSKLIKEVQASV